MNYIFEYLKQFDTNFPKFKIIKGTLQRDGSSRKYVHLKDLYLRGRRGGFQKNPVVTHLVRAFERCSVTSYSCWLFGNKLPTALCQRLFIH